MRYHGRKITFELNCLKQGFFSFFLLSNVFKTFNTAHDIAVFVQKHFNIFRDLPDFTALLPYGAFLPH